MNPIVIIGCGPGSADYVTPAARAAAHSAEVLAGSKRLLSIFPEASAQRIESGADVNGLLDQLHPLHQAGRRIAVLVSGDPGLFSLAKNVIARFGRDNCQVIPAVSSVHVAFARLGLDWADARILSAHGRTPDVAFDELEGCAKIAILAGTAEAMAWCADAAAHMATTHAAFLAENLTLPDERVRPFVPPAAASSLAIILLVRKELL